MFQKTARSSASTKPARARAASMPIHWSFAASSSCVALPGQAPVGAYAARSSLSRSGLGLKPILSKLSPWHSSAINFISANYLRSLLVFTEFFTPSEHAPKERAMTAASSFEAGNVVVRQVDAWSLMNMRTHAERRRAPRSWVRRRGELIIVRGLRGTSTIDCQILNTSLRGALIKVVRASDIPDDFYLIIDGQQERKITCSVARRGQKLLGVRFVQRL
jgi:hypothetical protein